MQNLLELNPPSFYPSTLSFNLLNSKSSKLNAAKTINLVKYMFTFSTESGLNSDIFGLFTITQHFIIYKKKICRSLYNVAFKNAYFIQLKYKIQISTSKIILIYLYIAEHFSIFCSIMFCIKKNIYCRIFFTYVEMSFK